jgi:hypothetical protein
MFNVLLGFSKFLGEVAKEFNRPSLGTIYLAALL